VEGEREREEEGEELDFSSGIGEGEGFNGEVVEVRIERAERERGRRRDFSVEGDDVVDIGNSLVTLVAECGCVVRSLRMSLRRKRLRRFGEVICTCRLLRFGGCCYSEMWRGDQESISWCE